MMAVRPLAKERRILAIRPTGRGFGFVVLEGPQSLLDWGVKEARPADTAQLVRKVSVLLRQYFPELLVVEDTGQANRRSSRARSLTDELMRVSAERGVPIRLMTKRKAKWILWPDTKLTQSRLAQEFVRSFPELKSSLPPERKPWMSQDARFAIFEALMLGLATYPKVPSATNAMNQSEAIEGC